MPRRKKLHTSDLARALGLHPNTIRLYEAWGYLPPVPRAPNGYRQFTPYHLDQGRLVRLALRCTWLSGPIRAEGLALIAAGAAYDLDAALDHARQVAALIRAEHAQAEAAVQVLERWADSAPDAATETGRALRIGEAARRLEVSVDVLRNWERNGLIEVPREAHSGYRRYGPVEIDRLRVIRTLRRARYSTMSILRMLLALDCGRTDLRRALDTPDPDDIVYVTDHWLSTVTELVDVTARTLAHVQAMRTTYGHRR
jgi:DNA-binding transcriptional MerR regulator